MRGGFFGLFVAILLIAAVVGVGFYAYNMGMAQSAAGGGNLVPPTTPGAAPYPYYYHPFFFHPFGIFGCLAPLFFFLVIFALIRAIFWGGRWGWGHHMHHGHWGEHGVPPMFEEWHKRAHEPKTSSNG